MDERLENQSFEEKIINLIAILQKDCQQSIQRSNTCIQRGRAEFYLAEIDKISKSMEN